MNANQKGTALVGGAVTDEVLESSASILTPGMYGAGQKGLQQFYSPPEAARLAAQVIGDSVAVLDPTAGDGSLLKEFGPTLSFGIEIDKDQIKASEGGYNPIQGDLQHVYTLLRLGMSPWDAIVANPPFGLQWSDPTLRDGKDTNSTVLTLMMVTRLLAEDGQFMLICGQGRHERQLKQLPDYSMVYAVIHCDDLFEGTQEPVDILFGVHDALRSTAQVGVLGERTVGRDMLDLCASWVTDLREKALDEYTRVAYRSWSAHQRVDEFKKVQDEYNRRVEKRIKTREFDAQLYNGDHIQWLPSAFATLALRQAGLLDDFYGLNGQPIAYFAQNERLWFKLGAAEERGLLTVDPRLRQAVATIIGDIQKHRVPLYRLKPQQRLGFLDDVDALVCTKSDPERRFREGEVYRLDTSTKTIVERTTEVVESKKNPGEYDTVEFERHKKVMNLQLSGQGAHYNIVDGGDNASQDISWLIDHFEIPDPGDIASEHPDRIAFLEALVREVLEEFETNSKAWEEKNKVSKPFSVRDFQVQDVARLLFKEFGVLAWEQGLGKTVGGLAFYKAATKIGAKPKLLIITPGDLKDQWCREIERFLGEDVKPEIITTHAQAKKIAKHLRIGGSGLYIAHYEAMAINGTLRKNQKLPVVTVREWEENQLARGTDKYGYWVWFRETDEVSLGRNVGEDDIEKLGLTDIEFQTQNASSELIEQMKELGFDQRAVRGYYPDHLTHGRYAFHGYIRPRFERVTKKLTSNDICPECHADTRNGWNGTFCEAVKEDESVCGYAHYAVKMKPIASLLSTAFHDGVALLDEITYIQGDDSKRSKAMRGIQARFRLGLSGTPIKNYVDQIFWPLAWCLGYSAPWFPYDYKGGKVRFEGDFCVIQFRKNGRRKEGRKVLPDVTNLSRFWRMLASHNIRRRQEETGEELVDIYYHEVNVPMGLAQAEQTKEWLKKLPHGFPAFFAEKYPDKKVVLAGMHEVMAPLLGLNWKLDYACVIPQADPDAEWPGLPDLSNFTPANLRTLELTMALVQQGRKVLVGSHIVAEGQWLAERLQEKGVNALHIVDESSGTTVSAKTRAKKVYSFQTDDEVQVFCAGMKAIRLGHNLDSANAVVINGLDFDYETLDQFVKRVRRLTSTQDVDVYIILPTLSGQQTITSRKWQILNLKGNAADLALDGRLIVKNEQEISEAEMVRELQERGLTITDDAIEEAEIEEAWNATAMLDDFEGAALIPERPPKIEPEEVLAADDEDQMSLAAEVPDVVADELLVEQNANEFDAIDAAEEELAAAEPHPWVGDQDALDAAAAFDSFLTGIVGYVPIATSDFDSFPDPESEAGASDIEAAATEPEVDADDEAKQTPAPSLDYMGQLKQAKELLDLGVLSQDEFDGLKADLLAGLRAAA